MPFHHVDPYYPEAAAAGGLEGWVAVEYSVEADGSVANLRVTEAQRGEIFGPAALEAVSQWRFCPASTGVRYPDPATVRLQFRPPQ